MGLGPLQERLRRAPSSLPDAEDMATSRRCTHQQRAPTRQHACWHLGL